jgi:hypothetical protein
VYGGGERYDRSRLAAPQQNDIRTAAVHRQLSQAADPGRGGALSDPERPAADKLWDKKDYSKGKKCVKILLSKYWKKIL